MFCLDLLEALDNGSLKGAAIDVFEHEGGPVLHSTVTKLANHPSVICTPHLVCHNFIQDTITLNY